MQEQGTVFPSKETEPQQPVNLIARVITLSHKIGGWNNFAYARFGNDEHECGHAWEDYIIEASVLLTDAPQNKDYHLQKLVLYTQSPLHYLPPPGIQDAYLQKIGTLKPGKTVLLTIDAEALGKHEPLFMGELDSDYDEEDLTGGKGYIDNPDLVRLREEIRLISRNGFTSKSAAVNLEFVTVRELPTS